MRIALFNLDGAGTHKAIHSFLQRHRDEIVYVGLSPPFRPERGGFLRQTFRHTLRSGSAFSDFLGCNFLLPRVAHATRTRLGWAGATPTIADVCQSAGVEVHRVNDVNGRDVTDTLARLGVDLIASCFFDQFFKREVLAVPRFGAVNVHTSLLPRHRGPMPVIYSALDQPPTLGVTVHGIEEGIDTGPMLAQEPYQPAVGESIMQSMARLHHRGLEMLSQLLPAIADGTVRRLPQSGGSYESFPTGPAIRALRRQGTPLITWRDIKQAFAMPIET